MAGVEDFNKLEILTGRILQVSKFPEAHKPAVEPTIDFGPGTGIKKSSARLVECFKPEDLVGKMILAVVNLAPRKIGPFVSEVLVPNVPDEQGETVLVIPENEVNPGAKLH